MKQWAALVVLLLFGAGMAFGNAPGEESSTGTKPAAGVSSELTGTGTGQALWDATIDAYEKATGNTIGTFDEAPILKSMVSSGTLPQLSERLPKEPLVHSSA